MALVVDASVTIAWFFADEVTSFTESVLDRVENTEAVVPATWPLEICNVLLVAERRRRVTAAQTAYFLRFLETLPITVDPVSPNLVLGPVLALGREHDLTAYDASYLELAVREGLPLATLDAALMSAARRVGTSLVQ